MDSTHRLLNFPTAESYADQLTAAKARVERALRQLRLERAALERLLLTNKPAGRTH